MPPKRRYVVSRADQLRALRSPLRQEIIDAVAASGPRSVAELAEILGRPADALYYHVRRLQRVGLLVTSGTRRTPGRMKEVVDLPGHPVSLPERTHQPSHRKAVEKIVATMLRLTARQYLSALRRETVPRAPGRRVEWASRVSGWLTAAERDRLMRALGELNDMFQSHKRDPRRRLHAFTFAITPVAPSSRFRSGSGTRADGTPGRVARRRRPL